MNTQYTSFYRMISIYDRVRTVIERMDMFASPQIMYILTSTDVYADLLTGIVDEGRTYFITIGRRYKVIDYEELAERYESEQDHVLQLLEDHDPIYMSNDFHVEMYRYIDSIEEEADPSLVVKYLNFCRHMGITHTFLENHSRSYLNDIEMIFNELSIDGFDLILYEDVGEKRVMMGGSLRFYDGSERPMFRTMVVSRENDEIEYSENHRQIENAYEDFNNRYFSLLYALYRKKETDNDMTIREFRRMIDEYES